jgi:hypothetical protein
MGVSLKITFFHPGAFITGTNVMNKFHTMRFNTTFLTAVGWCLRLFQLKTWRVNLAMFPRLARSEKTPLCLQRVHLMPYSGTSQTCSEVPDLQSR